jgi:hypothetical protein
VLFNRNHYNDKDELGSKEHLDKEALSNIRASAERGRDGHRAREQRRNHTCRSKAAEKLGNDNDDKADGREATDKEQSEGDLTSITLA